MQTDTLPVAGVDFTFWNYGETDDSQPRGLGALFQFRYEWDVNSKYVQWCYRSPRGMNVAVCNSTGRKIAPPLPQKHPKKCGCGKPHSCSQCGQPYWVEFHGCAAGYCTYCYHIG